MKKLLTVLLFIVFIAPASIQAAPGTADWSSTYTVHIGVVGNLSSCASVGGKALASIDNPEKLIAEGMIDARAGDKLEVTRISKDFLSIKNQRTGDMVNMDYGYYDFWLKLFWPW